MKSYVLAATFALLFASSAFGRQESNGTGTGNEVLTKCQTEIRAIEEQHLGPGDAADANWCIGWMTGVIETNLFRIKTDPVHFCLPKGVNVGQAIRIVVKYLKDHPERLHERGIVLAITALKDAFPCQ